VADFSLGSVDWSSVSLLHGEHLRVETAYLEDLVRWSLRYGRPYGVIYLEEDDLQVSGSSTDYEITLRNCQAVTPRGYWVEVSEAVSLQGSNDAHAGSVVPIHLGVSLEKEPVPLAPAQSQALLECRSLHWRYTLSCESEGSDRDWLPIGQMQKEGSRFVRDAGFIPECVHLNSHPALISTVEETRQKAGACLRELQNHIHAGLVQAGVMAAAMVPAAVVVDWAAPPRAFLERLAEVLTAQQLLLWAVDKQVWGRANDLIKEALDYIEENARYDQDNVNWRVAFNRVKEALDALILVFRGLRPVRMETPSTDSGPREFTHEPVVPVRQSQVGPARRRR